MVKSGGISIFPEEIEDIASQTLPMSRMRQYSASIAQQWGEAVKAFVVLNKDAACRAEYLLQFCKDSLASYKAPKAVEFLSALPRTGLGKIDRGKLEAMNRSK